MHSHGRIYIGTSGWHYEHWKGPFYPDEIAAGRFLEYYAGRFSTVEINNSFYRRPERATLIQWRDATPRSFLFAVKASRYITHMKKLTDSRKPLAAFLARVGVLEDKLGPILFQLPPRWKVNAERLRAFLRLLPKDRRFAFEFRDPSWFTQEVYDALADAKAAFCIYQLAGLQSPGEMTADFVYVRLHGPTAEAYRGRYPAQTLRGWAGAFAGWTRAGKDVYCYFDNDEAGYAALDAARLREMTR
jgi:uncharacterized protein YecE (DUF72 family)